ncbi:MAG: cupin domain-containing protein, partial [[Clostridium] symbiosum]
TYYIIRGEGEYNDNGTIRTVVPGDRTFTPSGFSHGMANNGDTDLVFMALIIYD